jgi:hypothetical protein
MPTVIACHELRKDTEHWLASPQREEVLPALGASNIRTFVDQQNPRQVAVLMDVDDLDQLHSALENPSPDLVEAMDYDGVVAETLTILVES